MSSAGEGIREGWRRRRYGDASLFLKGIFSSFWTLLELNCWMWHWKPHFIIFIIFSFTGSMVCLSKWKKVTKHSLQRLTCFSISPFAQPSNSVIFWYFTQTNPKTDADVCLKLSRSQIPNRPKGWMFKCWWMMSNVDEWCLCGPADDILRGFLWYMQLLRG